MNAELISKAKDKMKILIETENNREKLILMTLFFDAYALEKFLKENRSHLSADEPDFTHAEIKEVADKIYISI